MAAGAVQSFIGLWFVIYCGLIGGAGRSFFIPFNVYPFDWNRSKVSLGLMQPDLLSLVSVFPSVNGDTIWRPPKSPRKERKRMNENRGMGH